MGDQMDEKAELLAAMDGVADFVAGIGGIRAQLVRDGWSDDEARALVVAAWQQNAANAMLAARGVSS